MFIKVFCSIDINVYKVYESFKNFSRCFFSHFFPFWLVGIGSSLVLKLLLLLLLESWNIGHSKSSIPKFVSSSSRSFFARTKTSHFLKSCWCFDSRFDSNVFWGSRFIGNPAELNPAKIRSETRMPPEDGWTPVHPKD